MSSSSTSRAFAANVHADEAPENGAARAEGTAPSPTAGKDLEANLDADRIIGPLLRGCSEFHGVTLPKAILKGKVYSAPWEGSDMKIGFFDIMKWKTKCAAPKFPTPEEAAVKCPSVDRVNLEQLVRGAPLVVPGSGLEGEAVIQSTWMGHASFLVQTQGVNILTDPVWTERASPVQFAGPKRYVPAPLALENFPCPVHVVTISHNHYDHLCAPTVEKLRNLFDPVFVVPLGMKKQWFEPLWESKHPASLAKVYELDWWECATIPIRVPIAPSAAGGRGADGTPLGKTSAAQGQPSHEPVVHDEGGSSTRSPFVPSTASTASTEPSTVPHVGGRTGGDDPTETLLRTLYITFVPVQHWALRSGFDRNYQLWGAFVYEIAQSLSVSSGFADGAAPITFASDSSASPASATTPQQVSDASPRVVRFFHSGDTGYCNIFKDVGTVFQRFDLAMIPIGAYEPRYIMRVQHVDPEEAVQIHLELNRPTLSLGMHWGTWILTDEPVDEPPRLLAESLLKHQLPLTEFVALKHGETVAVPATRR
jgi:L-ascorbate metabolism protein UlaG (beta-lactamase superfamily)